MFNILVVEDDSTVATELVELLMRMGHRAEWSAAQGLVTIAAGCDLVLLDPGAGAPDSFPVLDRLATVPGCPPIAIMSGRDGRFMQSAQDVAQARGLRTVAMLPKPFSPRELAALLDELEAAAALAEAEPAQLIADPYYVFQYKNDLRTGARVGAEVLVRLPGITDIEGWFMALGPDQAFAMTMAAANAAIDLHRRLAAQDMRLPVAFNCPSDVFSSPDFLGGLKRACGNGRVEPAYIGVELTEQKGAGATIDIASMACRYALAGFPVLLDDFGTGTASLDHLLRLPLSEMKIDSKVFHSLARGGRALLHEIAAFCRSNGIISTVEGIETDDDMRLAREAGADCGQGFLWSRPSPIADILGA